ncbi:hypothetical protein K438DRAFT_2000201 [Mycena galopus ATCC 62051]|nr:hypothetical protein K438DRAFT_2000201 [Mycena galopus ATCC 62051]
MHFTTTAPSVLLGQLETSLGAPPGAGGALYFAHEIGRRRMFEYVLSSQDMDSTTAEPIGWVNRAFSTSFALADYIETLAACIALFPTADIATMKTGINTLFQNLADVIIQSQEIFIPLVNGPISQALLAKFLIQTNNQSVFGVFNSIPLVYVFCNIIIIFLQ